MRNFLFLFSFSLFIISSCTKEQVFKDPEFRDITDVNIQSVNMDSIIVTANCVMYNPNIIPLDLSNMEFDLKVNDKESGTVKQTIDVQMPADSDFEFPVQFSVSPKEIWGEGGGGLLQLGLQLLGDKKFDLYMDGTVKAGAKGVFVQVPFKHEQEISLKK